MLTIELPHEVETRLKSEASRLGLDAADYARKLIEAALPKPAVDQVTIDLLDKWDREQATDDPEEIARRQIEAQEFMDGMNRNRVEMEGPVPPNQASIDALTKWERENATDDPEEIARRQIEFEEFKAGMNRNRLESERSNARLVYPD